MTPNIAALTSDQQQSHQSSDVFNFDPNIQLQDLVFGIINKYGNFDGIADVNWSIAGKADVHAEKSFFQTCWGVAWRYRLSSLFAVDMFQGKVVNAEYVSQKCTKKSLAK